jgi:hypothetical protein
MPMHLASAVILTTWAHVSFEAAGVITNAAVLRLGTGSLVRRGVKAAPSTPERPDSH